MPCSSVAFGYAADRHCRHGALFGDVLEVLPEAKSLIKYDTKILDFF